ncbi:16S rRNA (guanine(966)-N(2))-methyltransferase RsmD [Microbacterium dauci]|uniref:16S rRNA (Guanine(966)-N(2))-methyltransferase RsmD n=1 Tax=Microbacterium dauci TaxID=3048008 RepID=A0ABT6ZBS7_9MICO|nr:16S rRNA (guanine(966)-N(2))-methyltransferase RsmD [Microbacterium sp. LX3-4]MDJ1113614.1 16S rRNA (guanine(966)-N(2))-methyltransferase RsmD [Microbacterium sp. LX3-4]
MTRIIAGAAGSLTLGVPDAGTRPTSERVRESLFGALDAADAVSDAAVLDLYAGSGALGLEAVSRGAASADLVERAPKAAKVAEQNARAVGRSVPQAALRVHRAAADAFLRQGATRWDLVFIDPPYDLSDDELTATLTLLTPRLTPDALVVLERSSRSPEPSLPAGLVVERSKRYGDTTLWWVGAG